VDRWTLLRDEGSEQIPNLPSHPHYRLFQVWNQALPTTRKMLTFLDFARGLRYIGRMRSVGGKYHSRQE